MQGHHLSNKDLRQVLQTVPPQRKTKARKTQIRKMHETGPQNCRQSRLEDRDRNECQPPETSHVTRKHVDPCQRGQAHHKPCACRGAQDSSTRPEQGCNHAGCAEKPLSHLQNSHRTRKDESGAKHPLNRFDDPRHAPDHRICQFARSVAEVLHEPQDNCTDCLSVRLLLLTGPVRLVLIPVGLLVRFLVPGIFLPIPILLLLMLLLLLHIRRSFLLLAAFLTHLLLLGKLQLPPPPPLIPLLPLLLLALPPLLPLPDTLRCLAKPCGAPTLRCPPQACQAA
mmetsp:Transcript_16085/g.37171  ORF Transcript_16085/g.37171 Transcript_16085/m.37171 type:complete len:282 (+) Transcript_16085:1788-2633(+)